MIPQKYLTIPVAIYDGEVEIQGKKDLHPLHKLVLQLVVIEHDLEKVVDSFNIKPQIVHEAIIDLLYRELIHLDLEKSRIYATFEVETAIDRGRLDDFLGIQYPEKVNIRWMQDMVSGQVFMLDDAVQYLRKPSNLGARNQQRLSKSEYVKITDLNAKTLIKVAKMNLRSRYFDADLFDRISRINDLRLRDTSILYIPLIQKNLTEKQSISVPDAPSIPATVIEKWTKGISDLDPYSISDLSPADENYLLNYHWTLLVQKIWDVINGVSIVFSNAPNQSKKRALRLTSNRITQEILDRLHPMLANLAYYKTDADISFFQGSDILERLWEKVLSAKSLVILGSSFISQIGMQQISELFEILQENKIQVILIWGNLGRGIEDPRDQFPILKEDWISLIRSNTQFHSKFLIIDNEIAWITSCNLLSYRYDSSSPKEMVCEIKETKNIDDIIEYARTKLNQNSVEITWIDNLIEKSDQNSSVDVQIISTLREKLTEFRDNCLDLLRNIGDNSKLQIVRGSFDDLKGLKKELLKLNTGILVKNLEHRKILRSILTNTSKYIRLGTDNVYNRAIGPVITRDLNNALDEGISVEVIWGKDDPENISDDDLLGYESTIKDLKSSTMNRISIQEIPSHSHAKYLTMDYDLIVVTSFNLLAFSGNGLDDADITDELGIVISGKGVIKGIFDNSS